MRDEFLTADAVAQQIGVAKQTLARWRCEGIGPKFVKLGQRVAYRRCDLDAWIARNVCQKSSDWIAA